MSQTIRERLALQDEANRRALTQRMLRAGDYRQEQDDSNIEGIRAGAMLVGAILWTVFVLFCAVAGITAADWWSDGAAFVASVPAGAECMK